jgi:cytochrome c5
MAATGGTYDTARKSALRNWHLARRRSRRPIANCQLLTAAAADYIRDVMKAFYTVLLAALVLTACNSNEGKEKYTMTDAQLGLTPPQGDGRRVYNQHCLQCHASYTKESRKSFSLKALYTYKAMPSGTPTNDERISDLVAHGKRMMPATQLSPDEMQALLAYLHTL